MILAGCHTAIPQGSPRQGWRERLALRALECLDSNHAAETVIRRILQHLSEESGIRASGIRLRRGEDFPYYAYNGFSREFLRLEWSLCSADNDGKAIRDENGRKALACVCGRVLRGDIPRGLECFTAGGSFFSPSLSTFVSSPDLAALGPVRGQCLVEGFETLCLTPLRNEGGIAGLLHLGDPRPAYFTQEDVLFLERLAGSIGIALSRERDALRIRETESRYQELFSEMNMGFAAHRPLLDADGRLVDFATTEINRAYQAVLGLSDRSVVGRRGSEYLPPGELATWLAVLGDVVGRGVPTSFEVSSSGAGKHFAGYAFAPRKGRLAVLVEDVTEKKRLDSALRAHERSLMRVNECLVGLGANYEENVRRITTLCGELMHATCSLYCRRKGDTAHTIGKWQAPPDLPSEHGHRGYLCCAVHGQTDRNPLLIRGLQDTPFAELDPKVRAHDLRSYLGVGVWDGAELLGVLSLLYQRDVLPSRSDLLLLEIIAAALGAEERRHKTAQALQRQEASLRALFENMVEAFALHEAILDEAGRLTDYRFVAVNRAFERLCGIRSEELIGRTASEVLPDLDPELLARYRQVVSTGEHTAFELRVDRFGRDFAIAAYRPEPQRFACVFSDITDRREAQANQARMLEVLHGAQRAKAIEILAGGVAHDFNNLLAGLLGCLSVLELELGPKHRLEADIADMKGSIERGADLVWQLVDFARQAGREVGPLDINEQVAKTARLFSSTRRDITVALSLPPGLAPIRANRAQVEQVLLNLFVNAAHAMPSGGTLTIVSSLLVLPEDEAASLGVVPGPFVQLSVSDTGRGIAPEILDRVFEPFFTTREAEGGVGLGLASVHGIVRHHGGFVKARSVPNEGATFTVALPTSDQPQVEARPHRDLCSRGSETLLLVDDEEHVRRTTRRLLESLGYAVLTARDGVEAMDIYRQDPRRIALVILDTVMPRLGGREAAKAMRAINPQVRVLLVGDHSADGLAGEIPESASFRFLQKPFTSTELSTKLRELLFATPELYAC